jgi:PKD repeat protein
MRFLKHTWLIARLLLSFPFLWSGCTEKEDTIIYLDTPTSCFQTYIQDRSLGRLRLSDAVLLDSTIYFENCSDSSQTIRYKWDFGDGTNSDLKNPSHKFTRIGKYKVILTTTNRDKALDTASTVISVIIGQKNFNSGATISNSAIDVVETNSGFVMLGITNDNTVYPYAYTSYLMTLDEKMNKKSIKTYPANTRFNSISPDKDNNFILTGSTQEGDISHELIKMNSEGSILWSKNLGSTNALRKVFPTSDNGYILTATRNIPGNNNNVSRTLLIKTDAQGNQIWEKFMNQDLVLEKATEVVVENDGYVLAGVSTPKIETV